MSVLVVIVSCPNGRSIRSVHDRMNLVSVVTMAESDEQYDALGEAYERVKYIPTGLCERATFLSALPPLTGKTVLDVACGTGFYPRQFVTLGAARVVGVDSSHEMVSYAQ